MQLRITIRKLLVFFDKNLIAAKRHKMHKKEGDFDMLELMELCDVVRETSFAIHKYLKNGHLEKIYENALMNTLSSFPDT